VNWKDYGITLVSFNSMYYRTEKPRDIGRIAGLGVRFQLGNSRTWSSANHL